MPSSEGVKHALISFYERFSSGDVTAMAELITKEEDAIVIGTDPAQWTAGRDEWIAGFQGQVEQMPGLQMQAGNRLQAYEEGSVGWAADEPSVVFPDGGGFPVRVTAVFRQEGGEWKIVNAHVSIAVPDAKLEELLPQLLG